MSTRSRVAALAATFAAISASPVAGANQTFTDPVGDAPATTDITAVVVSEDGQGSVILQVAIPGLQALPPNFLAAVAIDTDMNRLTGDQEPSVQGIDFIAVSDGSNVGGVAWNGSDFARADLGAARPAASASLAAGVLTVSLPAARLHIAEGIRFGVTTALTAADGSTDTATLDAAPGGPLWTHVLGPPKLLALGARMTPAHPAAGAVFSASLVVREKASGRAAAGGTVACHFTAGGKRLASVRGSVSASGRVQCSGAVPRTAGGLQVHGTVEYRYHGATLTHAFSARAR
jgi:hypothetical protein